jgi:hypothetical protein
MKAGAIASFSCLCLIAVDDIQTITDFFNYLSSSLTQWVCDALNINQ